MSNKVDYIFHTTNFCFENIMSMAAEEEAFVQLCKDVFSSMDLDKNGRITPYIVGQVMKQYGWNLKPYELVVSLL